MKKDLSELPDWMHGGKYLKPVRIFPDPFRRKPNILVLCEGFAEDKTPAATNHRFSCKKTMLKAESEVPWFGMEQEWTMLDADGHPYRWPKQGYPGPQGIYSCAVGFNRAYGRQGFTYLSENPMSQQNLK